MRRSRSAFYRAPSTGRRSGSKRRKPLMRWLFDSLHEDERSLRRHLGHPPDTER